MKKIEHLSIFRKLAPESIATALLVQLQSKSHTEELLGFTQDMEGMSRASSRVGGGASIKPGAVGG